MANHGAVCVGRDLEEAFVVCQVLEKACKAFIEAEFLGGAKSINKFEAHLMHQIYITEVFRRSRQKQISMNKENHYPVYRYVILAAYMIACNSH